MRLDELYKFCDGTLTSVRKVLHDIASSLRMNYLPKRRWSKLDRKRSRIMIKMIDQKLFERRLMRNLEKFVGQFLSDTKVFTMTMEILLEPTSNKLCGRCLSRKTLSNDRLRPSRIEILWSMYYEAKVDYAAMMWEDLQYQIDNRQTKVRRREIMPYPRFTKAIIHHFMSQHKSIFKREGSPYHTIADDG
ncbi:hypothetical protein Tco_1015059 [Tanacetum coccineum]|uniref:Uncharacterized protein n=1 Tax=Tanacetum coccineum TaxID=301880 RepID=A0ABQ5FKF5_9ASTR